MQATSRRQAKTLPRLIVFAAALIAAGALTSTASAFSFTIWINGAGTVTGQGINCASPLSTPTGAPGEPGGAACSEDYGTGFVDAKTVTASVPSGWSFAGWQVRNTTDNVNVGVCLGLTLTCTVGGWFDSSNYRILASFTDNTPPSITLASSGPVGTVGSDTATFSFSSTDSVARFKCQLDAGPLELNCTSPKTYAGLTHGLHTFQVQAYDPSGNHSSFQSRTWSVDKVAPTATITSGPSGLTNSSSATFGFGANEPATFQCLLTGSSQSHGFVGCASPRSYSALQDGSYTFQIRATDGVGNVSGVESRSWTVDTVAPTTPVVSQGGATTSSITANWTSTDANGVTSYELFLNGASAATHPGPVTSHTFSGLQCGTAYSVGVEAVDAVGNRSSRGTAPLPTSACPVVTPPPPPVVTPPPPPRTVQCVVPKLKGKTLAAAKTALKKANCATGKVTRAYSSTVRVGRIIRHTPAAGKRLTAGAKVALVVSRGRR